VFALAIAALGCSGKTNMPSEEAETSQQRGTEGVVYVMDPGSSWNLVKRLPVEPDPPDTQDPDTCRDAGGDWADAYYLGVLIERGPEGGGVLLGKRCWRTRHKLADGGKSCNGQADCIGNCMFDQQRDGTWRSPRCQMYAEEWPCGPIYDGGEYHWIMCPVE
jgi:hypothetical protein